MAPSVVGAGGGAREGGDGEKAGAGIVGIGVEEVGARVGKEVVS